MNGKMIKVSLGAAAVGALVFLGMASITGAEPSSKNKAFTLPANAKEVAPDVFSLGTAYDKDSGKVVEGYAFVHKKNFARTNGAKPAKSSSCYGYIASGAKWKTLEPWIVNASNTDSILPETVFAVLDGSINKWEAAAGGKDIFGVGTLTNDPLAADNSSPDGQNEVMFGSLDAGTIGVTIAWGIWGGSPNQRVITEWDQVYNTYYPWSAEVLPVSGTMDFENIATHELGHSFGMGDIYTSSCSNVTMFGYADYGEFNKRDLEPADKTGIFNLYI